METKDSSEKFPCPINNTESSVCHLKTLTEFLLGLVTVFSFPLLVLLSIPIYLYRFAVIVYAKYFRNDLDEILTGVSSYLVNDYFDNKTPRAAIVVPIIIRGQVTLEELKELVKTRWIETNDHRFKNFCQYPIRWMGYTFYKKAASSIHINNHVHLYSKPKQRVNGHVTKEEVTIFSEKLLNTPFTPFTSPWEVHLIQNYKHENICSESEHLSVFIFKLHHSLADGFGVMAAFVQAFSQQTLADLKIPKPVYPNKSWLNKLTSCIVLSLNLISEMGHFLYQAVQASSWKVPDEKKQWYQLCFRSDIIPVQKLQRIRNTFRISFSSIIYAAVSAGIQKSMQDSQQTHPKKTKDMAQKDFKEVHENRSIYCLHAIPLPGHPMSLTNHVTLTFLDLPICNYGSPIDRLHRINMVLKSSRVYSCIPWTLPWLSYICGCYPYPILKFFLKNKMVPVGVTNFPLDSLHFEINGKKAITADFLAGALDGVTGVGIMFMSYGQYVRVSSTAEGALMCREDINRFGKYMVDEIERLFLMACSALE